MLRCAVLCCAVLCSALLCSAADARHPVLTQQCMRHTSQNLYHTTLCMQDKKGGKLRRRSSKQTLLLSPYQDDMSEDGGSKSRSESMLDVARGLSASLQNIRRYAACACGSLLMSPDLTGPPKLGLQICICACVSGASRDGTTWHPSDICSRYTCVMAVQQAVCAA